MKSLTNLHCMFMTFLVICIVSLGCCAPQNKDDVTNTTSYPPVGQPKGMDTYLAAKNDMTNTISNLTVDQSKSTDTYLAAKDDVTNTTSNPPVVQSNGIETYSAAEMCANYSKSTYKLVKDPSLLGEDGDEDVYIRVKDCKNFKTLIVNGTKADAKEFPHMALLGYSRYPSNDTWGCGGSLISERWILSAAHCAFAVVGDEEMLVRWARLGDLNYLTDTDDAKPKDYQINHRVVHPDYKPPSLYNDIALFRLDRKVKFSSYIRPICLNADSNWQSSTLQTVIATGWGQVKYGGQKSPDLLKVILNIIPTNLCKSNYALIEKSQLMHGILEDSMMCAGYEGGEKDTCGGDSGGPLQILHSDYSCMYMQVGVTSAGKQCATMDSPGIYTRVSKFLPWIERIVWPKSGKKKHTHTI